jgi:hypothetical protein
MSTVLAKLAVQISANTAEFNKNLSTTQKSLNSFVGNIKSAAGAVGLAFGASEVANFALDVSKLAGQAEAVRTAFERLPQSTQLMMDLKSATGNTVSELELMKRAVQANNFEISLKALPRLLEFATLRAQQTGQSVDYLVDSIVTGIGRKSKLILDNLGISAVQLNEALGGASTAASTIGEVADAVGKIAEENLKNMAGFSDNAATKLQKLSASWENVKVALGNAANGTGVLGSALDHLNKTLDVSASEHIPTYLKYLNLLNAGLISNQLAQYHAVKEQQKANKEAKEQAQVIREVDKYFKEFNGDIDAYGKTIETHVLKERLLAEFRKRMIDDTKKQVENLDSLRLKQKELIEQFSQTDLKDESTLNNIASEIIAVDKLIAKYESLYKAKGKGIKQAPGDTPKLFSDFKSSSLTGGTSVDASGISAMKPISSDWSEENAAALENYQDQLRQTADVAQEVGGIIGSAFDGALSGQQSFVQGLGQITAQIIQMYLKQSIAAMIAASIKDPTTPLPIMKIAAAAAGIAAVGALFRSIGGKSSGGSSSARYSGGSSRGASGNSANTFAQDSAPVFTGIIRGSDMHVMLENYRRNSKYTAATQSWGG